MLLAANFLRTYAKRSFIFIVVISLLSACQTSQHDTSGVTQDADQIINKNSYVEQKPEATNQPNHNTDLDANLLYDILVASIASQRNRLDVALESLSRAAYQSRDRQIISEAIQLAMDTKEYKKAINLAQLLSRSEPGNYLVTLTLANAQFKLSEKKIAYTLLLDLVNEQTIEDTTVLQHIASLLANQNQTTVLREFLEYVDNDPNNVKLALTGALLASRLKNLNEFTRLLDKTLDIKPDWELPATLKLSELSNRDLESMMVFAQKHLTTNPSHESFRMQYARIFLRENKIDEPLNLLMEVLKLNPDSSDALFTSGIVYLEKNMPEPAKTALVKYLRLNPNNDQARIYLSDIEFGQNNYSAAANYLHGVSTQRYYLESQLKMARIIAKRSDIDSALNYIQQIEVYNDDDRTRLILEQDELLRENQLFDRSILILDRGLELFPEQPDLLYNRGLLAAQMNLLEVHERDMRKLISLQPDNAHAYNALGYTLADQTDRLVEAKELISKANELLPDNGFILDSMGWVFFRLGNNQKAIEFLRRALQVRQDAEIAAHLGEVLWVVGDKAAALDIWQQGTEWAPENTILLDTIKRLSEQSQSSYFKSGPYVPHIAQTSVKVRVH